MRSTVFFGHLLAVLHLLFVVVNPTEACGSTKHICKNKACQNNAKSKEHWGKTAAHWCLKKTSCLCPGGFNGDCCEKKIEWCASSPCHNGGTCEDGFKDNYKDKRTFICTCPEGYEGDLCDKKRFQCRENPCLNSGICSVEHLDTKPKEVWNVRLKCDCPKGTSGERCEINYDDCQNHQCYHDGGDCVDGIDGYTCKCRKGWMGDFCEVRDYCATAACSTKGGICTSFINGTTKCECKKGKNGRPAYEGKNCEKIGPDYPCKKHYRHQPCHYGRRIFCNSNPEGKSRFRSCEKSCFSGKKHYWTLAATKHNKKYWRKKKCRVVVGKNHEYGNKYGYLDCTRGWEKTCIKRNAALFSCHDFGKGGDC